MRLPDLDALTAGSDDTSERAVGEVVCVEPMPGIAVLKAFSPGEDTVRLDLTAQSVPMTAILRSLEGGLSLSFPITPEAPTTIVFHDLGTTPNDDVLLRLTDAATGRPFETSLSDAVAAGLINISSDPNGDTVQRDPPSV